MFLKISFLSIEGVKNLYLLSPEPHKGTLALKLTSKQASLKFKTHNNNKKNTT